MNGAITAASCEVEGFEEIIVTVLMWDSSLWVWVKNKSNEQ